MLARKLSFFVRIVGRCDGAFPFLLSQRVEDGTQLPTCLAEVVRPSSRTGSTYG
jgi:hypothetical protein